MRNLFNKMKFTMWNQISDRLNWYWYSRADYYCYFILLLSTNNPWTTLILKSHLLIGFLDGSEQRWGFDRCWRNLLQSTYSDFSFFRPDKIFFSLWPYPHIVSNIFLQLLMDWIVWWNVCQHLIGPSSLGRFVLNIVQLNFRYLLVGWRGTPV